MCNSRFSTTKREIRLRCVMCMQYTHSHCSVAHTQYECCWCLRTDAIHEKSRKQFLFCSKMRWEQKRRKNPDCFVGDRIASSSQITNFKNRISSSMSKAQCLIAEQMKFKKKNHFGFGFSDLFRFLVFLQQPASACWELHRNRSTVKATNNSTRLMTYFIDTWIVHSAYWLLTSKSSQNNESNAYLPTDTHGGGCAQLIIINLVSTRVSFGIQYTYFAILRLLNST